MTTRVALSLLATVAAAFWAPDVFAAGPTIPIPPAVEILKTLRREHPRLLMSANDFARLNERIRSDTLLASWKTKLTRDAEAMLDQTPSAYELPDGKRLLSVSRHVQERVQTLGLAYRLTGDRRLADRAWRELEAAGNFKDWNQSHFLDTAEMTAVFALGYDWLFDVWTSEQRTFLRRAIVEMGIRPALRYYQNGIPSGWAAHPDNWNLVCNGGIGLGALALADEEPDLAGTFLNGALQSIQLAMKEFAPDGAWPEGPHYWNYATTYNILLLAALETALGTDFGLAKQPGFAECGRYAMHAQGPTGYGFNYADASPRRLRAPQLLWLARAFNQPALADHQLQAAAPEPLDLVYLSKNPPRGSTATEPLDVYFRHTEIATLRGDWPDRNAIWVGFKAGDNKANHSHLDLGSFVLEALGVRWAIDPGGDDYNLPGYFGGRRWTYYRLRAEGHNTLVINPGAGPDQEPSASAPITRFASKPDVSFAIADLTAAYSRDADLVRRGIALRQRKDVLVEDEWSLKAPGAVWWFLHTEAQVEIGPSGSSAVLSKNNNRLAARILSPAGAAFMIRSPEPLPESPHPERQARNAGSVLCIRLADTKEARLAVLFTPIEEGESEPSAAPAVAPLDAW
jgi:hypothetical protein